MKITPFLVCVLLLAATSAGAATVYNNDLGGVLSGNNTDKAAWNIEHAVVADSFVLSNNATVDGVDFIGWIFPANGPNSLALVNWAILANDGPDPASGTVLEQGSAAPPTVASPLLLHTSSGWDAYEYSFDIPDLALSAGITYWLRLGQSNVAGWIFWDESGGPSTGYAGDAFGSSDSTRWVGSPDSPCRLCTIDSESFDLLGTVTSGNIAPEPETLALLAGAAVIALGFRRR